MWYNYLGFALFVFGAIRAGVCWGKAEGMVNMLLSVISGYSAYFMIYVYIFKPFGFQEEPISVISLFVVYMIFFFLIILGILIRIIKKRKRV